MRDLILQLSKSSIYSTKPIDDERYQEEGTSKTKRVRCLLKQVDHDTAPHVLSALQQHKAETMSEQDQQSRDDNRVMISRLETIDADTAKGGSTTDSRNEQVDIFAASSTGFRVRNTTC
ncbi:hypothetical protein L8P23_22355 [Enterobacter roggenkampii]|nr:hypothetical protein [Enterobacter roggenkampii]EKY4019070.1 hypothetical protein [Enterobacter roggenkampii]MCK7073534.1 hypothetical protein [Enterobacter roggenkampii]MCK7095843.1 hypothetical protein [Enterobacter roggenkampii]MCK7234820.1 hypothetical protein [Enterobacter roggenkampii]